MRLTALGPQFIRHVTGSGDLQHVDTLADAQGIRFDCPKGEGHWVVVWFAGRGVPESEGPAWSVTGSGYSDLTLSPSVDCTDGGGCGFHGFVTNGYVS